MPASEGPVEEPDPCGEGTTLFAPTTYQRSTGRAIISSESFMAPHDGTICVSVQNGDESLRTRVSSASIAIDAQMLIGPSDFNKQGVLIERTMAVEAGEHVVSTVLHSTPGSYFVLTIKIAP